MKKVIASLTAVTLAGTLGACTYESQRDVLTGAIAGTAVAAAQTAVDGGDYPENMLRGGAIGAAAGAARGIAEGIASAVYPRPSSGYQAGQSNDGYGYNTGSGYNSGTGYNTGSGYNTGYGSGGYGYGQAGYGGGYPATSPNPYYGLQSVRSGYYPR